MRECLKSVLFVLACLNLNGFGQGTFIVDQQHTNSFEGGIRIQNQPSGQSFTPTINNFDTVVLNLANTDHTISPFVYVNLRMGSISGSLLGTSSSIQLPYNFTGTVDFYFPTQITLQPGGQYFLQPMLVSGGDVIANESGQGYTGGSLIDAGISRSPISLWFQEGITVVPEPSTFWLSLAGAGGLVVWRKRVGKI